MKKIIRFISIFFIIQPLFSQVGGISPTKLATNSPETIGHNTLEVEPNFSFIGGDKQYNTHHSNEKMTGNFNDVELGLRVAYGITHHIDIGTYIDEEFTILNLGGRYHFLDHKKFNLGIIAGLNIPLQEFFKAQSFHDEDNTTAYVIGLTSSYYFSNNFSIDSDIQFQDHFSSLDSVHKEDYFLNTDLGYQISDKWLIMSGLNYILSRHAKSINNSENLILNSGVAFFPSNTFFNCTINFPFSIYGKNSEKINGVQFAWTLVF